MLGPLWMRSQIIATPCSPARTEVIFKQLIKTSLKTGAIIKVLGMLSHTAKNNNLFH